MGRSYWFECVKCGYRAKVSGRADRGFGFFVQTIVCLDCRELYDAVTRLRVPGNSSTGLHKPLAGSLKSKPRNSTASLRVPPTFEVALCRLPHFGAERSAWLHYKLRCPVSSVHRVRPWSEPHKCPKCSFVLDRNALPYRIWD